MGETLYLDPEARLPYCRGCGHALVVRHLSRALARLQLPPRSVVLTTDIGCVGLADSLFPYLHTVHTTHGRSTAFATGMALGELVSEPGGLKPIVMIGDGGAMIGLLHLVHAAQLNVDVTVLVHNNFLFAMTGGQQSALTPPGFITATSPAGNVTPPLDLLGLLRSAHAGFLARQLATEPDLDQVIADAIAYPGFALVEVLELCTAFGTRWNELTGSRLKQIAAEQGLTLGRLAATHRPGFRELFGRETNQRASPSATEPNPAPVPVARLDRELRLVVAGSAGERVQSSAALFCQAALAAGLYSTQKRDNPVTQGTGFSVAEICLSSEPIEYTGMENPDVVVVTSADGWQELRKNGLFSRCDIHTVLLVDASLEVPDSQGRLFRLPLRETARGAGATLAALGDWLEMNPVIAPDAWEAALATLPESRRAELRQALDAGRRLVREVVV